MESTRGRGDVVSVVATSAGIVLSGTTSNRVSLCDLCTFVTFFFCTRRRGVRGKSLRVDLGVARGAAGLRVRYASYCKFSCIRYIRYGTIRIVRIRYWYAKRIPMERSP